MTSVQLVDERIETYLTRLKSALRGISPEHQQDILLEIRAHIMDSTEHTPDHAGAVDRVLRLLGTPEELAVRYSTECQLQRASRSFSPWLILRTCWQWAKLGIKGTLAFFVAMFGYGLALGFTVSVFIKPFMPSTFGWWSGPEGFGITIPRHPEQMHELLGNYFVPVIAAAAFVSAVGTTQLLRWMMRKRAPGLSVPTERHSTLSPIASQQPILKVRS
jgi:HAAS domain-containing protein